MTRTAAPGFRGAIAIVLASVSAFAASAADLRPASADPAPPLLLDRLDGPAFVLDAAAGAPVLVHFFATWCPPCIPEMAALGRLAGRWRHTPLTIVAIDVAEVDARVRRFLASEGITLPVLMDRDRAAARAWGVSSLPTSFLLDRSHALAFVAEGDVDWDAPGVDAILDTLTDDPAPAREETDAPT